MANPLDPSRVIATAVQRGLAVPGERGMVVYFSHRMQRATFHDWFNGFDELPDWSQPKFSLVLVCAVNGLGDLDLGALAEHGLVSRALVASPHRRPTKVSFLDALRTRVAKRFEQLGVPLSKSASVFHDLEGLNPRELLAITLISDSGGIAVLDGDSSWHISDQASGLAGLSLSRIAAQLHGQLVDSVRPSIALAGGQGGDQAPHPEAAHDLDLRVFGPPLSEEQAQTDEEWHQSANQEAIGFAVRRSVTLAEASSATGLSVEDLASAIDKEFLGAFEVGGQQWIPSWQFGLDRPLVHDLDRLLEHFPGDLVALTEWVETPNRHLGHRQPTSLLQAGRMDEVLTAVDLLAAPW